MIDLIVTKAIRFFEANLYVLQNLLETLRDEQMFDAVLSIAHETMEIGKQRNNVRFIAFAHTIIGEILIQEHSEEPEKVEEARKYLLEAFEAYQTNSEVLTEDEYGRVCMTLSTVYRLQNDVSQ